MSTAAPELVRDELELLQRLLPLEGARMVDLGCGKAEMSRRLVERGLVASVAALEVDEAQHELNVSSTHPDALDFVFAGADAIPFPDARFDLAIMLKSLHHVPGALLDRALAEIRRVLKPGGLLYVSEPVFAGEFNEIVRLFHDEEKVRALAIAALQRAVKQGVLEQVEERHFMAPIAFLDFDDFVERIVKVTHSDLTLEGAKLAEVRKRFEKHRGPEGAKFVRPMRVNLMRRPG